MRQPWHVYDSHLRRRHRSKVRKGIRFIKTEEKNNEKKNEGLYM